MPEHTHTDMDQVFSILKSTMKRYNVFSPKDLKEIIAKRLDTRICSKIILAHGCN
jgi:hypothetical protein